MNLHCLRGLWIGWSSREVPWSATTCRRLGLGLGHAGIVPTESSDMSEHSKEVPPRKKVKPPVSFDVVHPAAFGFEALRKMLLAGLCAFFWSLSASASFFDVKEDFGARGDGETDDTAAFQEAMNAAGEAGGGVVRVPAGNYRIESNLNIPNLVTLEGTWRAPGRLYPEIGDGSIDSLSGSVLLAYAGAGDEEGEPFVFLHSNSTIKGIAIFYPEQTRTNPPVAYPWTIASAGADNCSILDVLLINPYQAVDFGTRVAGRHFIRNLYAQALRRGLFVDQCYDVGRVENVHFWPFWTWGGPVQEYMEEHAEAFIFGRTDWQYLTNCFSIGYGVGFRFGEFGSGPGNVLMTQSGADEGPVAMLVENSQFHAGVTVSNSQMFGAILVKETNTGPVRFTSCGFFGSTEGDLGASHAILDGVGQTSFNNCHFRAIHPRNDAPLGIHVKGGGLSMVGCDFMDAGRQHLLLEEEVSAAVVTSNRFRGRLGISNRMKTNAVIENNVDGTRPEEKNAVVVDDSDGPAAFEIEGTWHSGVTGRDYLDGTRWAPLSGEVATATWRPDLPASGRYQVLMWWGADHHKDRASNALVRIDHREGVEEMRVDQSRNMGEWVSLGTFSFAAGRQAAVSLSTEGAATIPLADAVKFLPVKEEE